MITKKLDVLINWGHIFESSGIDDVEKAVKKEKEIAADLAPLGDVSGEKYWAAYRKYQIDLNSADMMIGLHDYIHVGDEIEPDMCAKVIEYVGLSDAGEAIAYRLVDGETELGWEVGTLAAAVDRAIEWGRHVWGEK